MFKLNQRLSCGYSLAILFIDLGFLVTSAVGLFTWVVVSSAGPYITHTWHSIHFSSPPFLPVGFAVDYISIQRINQD